MTTNSNITVITTDKAPKPFGHYVQATVHNGTVYVAGQLGVCLDDINHIGTIEEQTRQALYNIQQILLAAGSDLDHLLMVTIYVKPSKSCGEVNAVFSEVLGKHKPARAIITVADLPRGFDVEIIATAAVK